MTKGRGLAAVVLAAVLIIAALVVIGRLGREPQPSADPPGPRTVDTRIYDFFDVPLVQESWEQRAEVGFIGAQAFDAPVTIFSADVDGPDLHPGMPAVAELYGPTRVEMQARNLSEVTIDSIGGVRSPEERPAGFLPRDLMGGLGTDAPEGGTAHLSATMGFLDRARANELFVPEQFGYHGWETETVMTVTVDPLALRKVLGISEADAGDVDAWWQRNERDVESAWRWWLYDEGGNAHVGGVGRLDTRVSGGSLPLQIWLSDLSLRRTDDGAVLTWDLVAEPMEQLWARWLRESIQPGFESSSISDLHVDMTIGPSSTDAVVDFASDFSLYKVPRSNRWVWEGQLADVPNLTGQYVNESTYVSPATAYRDARYGGTGAGYNYVPGAWDLGPDDSLTFDFAPPPGLDIGLKRMEPPGEAFPGQIEVGQDTVRFEGPIDMEAWSREANAKSWRQLGDLLPWGEPYVTFTVDASPRFAARLADPPPPPAAEPLDPDRVVPPFPEAPFETSPPPPAEDGRSVRFDFYDWLDIPMVADRWRQYEANDYTRIDRLRPPVSYRTTPYFTGEAPAEPFSETTSGLRLSVQGRDLPEITMDTIGGGDRGAGFLPRDLMGGLGDGEPPPGGRALFEGHLQYGDREREARYRQELFWGYYGWETFLDAEITMDRDGARTILGITDDEFDRFPSWFRAHEDEVERRWKLWLFEEYKRLQPMPFFNFPLEIWSMDLEPMPMSGSEVKLQMTVLNEALDLVYSRWFNETFMPDYESSFSDLYLTMRIGPSAGDVDLDTANDWTLSADVTPTGERTWTFENFLGDNPYLAHEYRAMDSPALPYFGKVFRPGTPDEFAYDYTPAAFDLREGEQLAFHWAGSGMRLGAVEPSPEDFPGQIVQAKDAVTFRGPLDLTAWSRDRYQDDWESLGGLLPQGVPIITLRTDPNR
jgi:hypothetical protein